MNAISLHPTLKRNWEPLLHVLIISFYVGEKWINNWHNLPVTSRFFLTIVQTAFIALFYVNAFWLIPKFLSKGEFIKYAAGLIVTVFFLEAVRMSSYLLIFLVQQHEVDYALQFQRLILKHYTSLPGFIFSFTSIGLCLSFGYRFTKDWINNEKEKQTLIADKLGAELNFIRSQVNPHFLFNTLNNLFSIALKEKSENTANGITNLSSLMRYTLCDINQDYVGLEKEISFIEKYIALQKLRIAEDNPIQINLQLSGNFDYYKIAPMVLVPFIENAFKYGVSFTKKSFIDISIGIENDCLLLKVKNSINKSASKISGTGVGIKNVKDRMDIMYKDRYSLKVIDNGEEFHVQLKIELL